MLHYRDFPSKQALIVKRVLRKYKYPPDLQEAAVDLVLRQAQVLGESWSGTWRRQDGLRSMTPPDWPAPPQATQA